jgi:hypothetical protein
MAAAPSEPAPCSACSSTVDPPPLIDRGPIHAARILLGAGGVGLVRRPGRAYAAGVLRMKHLGRLVGSFASYAVVNRVWWILPLMAVLGLFGIVIAVGQAAAPYTIYTLF